MEDDDFVSEGEGNNWTLVCASGHEWTAQARGSTWTLPYCPECSAEYLGRKIDVAEG